MSLLRKKKPIKLNKSLKKKNPHRLLRIIFDQLSGSPIAQPNLHMKLTTTGVFFRPAAGRKRQNWECTILDSENLGGYTGLVRS